MPCVIRRQFLAATGGGVGVALSGCLEGSLRPRGGGDEFEPHDPQPSDPPDLPPGPEDAPERPSTITVETVGEYVVAFEYAYAYNTLHCGDLQVIDVASDSAFERETDHGVYAFGAATGYARCGSGPEPEHVDHGPPPFEWAVGEEHVVRIEDVDAVVDRHRGEAYGGGDDSRAAGLTLTNFDHLAHELDVSVLRGDETAFDQRVAVEPRATLQVRNVSAVAGAHDVSVETNEGATASGTWRVDPDRTPDRVVRVLATGELEVERLDPYDGL